MNAVSSSRLLLLALLLSSCGPTADGPASGQPNVPEPEMSAMEPRVRESLQRRRSMVLENPLSADAWGRFGMVAHAHELWEEAEIAYRQAEKLDKNDERWPYYLADVLSVMGTDLLEAERAFRRAMALRPDHPPAHMRLGNVLVANNQPVKAATEFERALELAPGLQQARVPLAQIRLSQGELEAAALLLEDVLEHSPRHGQALSTLGQVYMRQGGRDEAREIAERARDSASYNLFDDPLMAKVVAEGVSSVQLWERAKSFLENGNYQQAVLGLRQVVELMPANASVHQQLGVAYGNIGELESSRQHLEHAVSLEPELTSARVQLALLYLEQERPASAVPHLEAVLELEPEDEDAGWLLGKARLLTDDLQGAIATFEEAAQKLEAPAWAHNEWGRALVESGRHESGMSHFRAAMTVEPGNAQALFYIGLVLEGLGQIEEAADHYCRSTNAEPASPAVLRLQEIGHSCP